MALFLFAICDNSHSNLTPLSLNCYYPLIKYIYYQFVSAIKRILHPGGIGAMLRRRTSPQMRANIRSNPKKNQIEFYIQTAVVLKGITAFFYSTISYLFTCIFQYNNGVLNFRTVIFVISCAFLFKQITDKPYGIIPRCRSPPPNLLF